MTPTASPSARAASGRRFSFKPLCVFLAAAPMLWLAGCAASGGGGANMNSTETASFKQMAAQIAAQINASRATSQGVTAIKSPTGNSLQKGSATIAYSNASISNAGVLKVASSDVGTMNITLYSMGATSQTVTTTTGTFRLPLARVNDIHLGDWGTSQELGVSDSGTSKHAGLTTQARFDVNVMTDGEDVAYRSLSVSKDSFGSKPTKFADSGMRPFGTVATFQTRAQAAQFARQLYDLVSILRKGRPLSLTLQGGS